MQRLRDKTKLFFQGDMATQLEFRRQLRFLIIITLGFTIAFSWRQTIFDSVQSIILAITNIQNLATSSILTSITITIISILLIYLTSRLLRVSPEYR